MLAIRLAQATYTPVSYYMQMTPADMLEFAEAVKEANGGRE